MCFDGSFVQLYCALSKSRAQGVSKALTTEKKKICSAGFVDKLNRFDKKRGSNRGTVISQRGYSIDLNSFSTNSRADWHSCSQGRYTRSNKIQGTLIKLIAQCVPIALTDWDFLENYGEAPKQEKFDRGCLYFIQPLS
jgi:hypothetical protein